MRDGAAHKDDLATALAVDGQGNTVVVGHTETVASEPGVKGAVVKWDAAGHQRVVGGPSTTPASRGRSFYAVVTAGAGSIWAGGVKYADAETSNAAVVKYSPRGKRVWVRLWSQPSPFSSRSDQVVALALSGPSTLWAAGLVGGRDDLGRRDAAQVRAVDTRGGGGRPVFPFSPCGLHRRDGFPAPVQ